VVFFGDSITFGTGSNDDESLPSQVAALLPSKHVYNFAMGGWGPHEALRLAELGEPQRLVREQSGTIVYVLTQHNIRRAIGDTKVIATWGRDTPCYRLDESGVPTYRGMFPEAMPWWTTLADIWSSSHLLAAAQVKLPLYTTDAHIAFAGRLLLREKELLLKAWPSMRYVVVIYPTPVADPLPNEHVA
jgi:hypothetical protein